MDGDIICAELAEKISGKLLHSRGYSLDGNGVVGAILNGRLCVADIQFEGADLFVLETDKDYMFSATVNTGNGLTGNFQFTGYVKSWEEMAPLVAMFYNFVRKV